MSQIDAYVSMSNYAGHVQPVLDALPDDRRGNLYTPRQDAATAEHMRTVLPDARHTIPPSSGAPVIVGGFQDRVARRPTVLVSHGAGQTYKDVVSPSYDGGPGREHIGLFLCPNELSARRNMDRYSGAQACAVGCPKLDTWTQIPRPKNDKLTVAVAFHWDAHLHVDEADGSRTMVPEAGWALRSWRDVLERLARDQTIKLLGHGHPRAKRLLQNYWASIGVEMVWDATELLRRADVLLVDNSSLAYEWAACRRPVVLLNGEEWRRDVEHGLRFWDLMPGPDVWPWPDADMSTHDVFDAIDAAMDVPSWAERRAEITQTVYGPVDGRASERAVAAILEWEKHGCPHRVAYGSPSPCRSC